MDGFAKLPTPDQAVVFREAATQMGMPEKFVAKDFWVCWTLDKLFGLPKVGPHLIFKGGTSLSKVFGVTERFSEDIDVSLSREWLGFGGENDPERAPSRNKEREQLKALSAACAMKIHEALVPGLEKSFQSVLGTAGNDWRLEIEAADPQTVRFYYPGHPDPVTEGGGMLPYVKIELGARSDDWPAETKSVRSYAAERVPKPFKRPACDVRVLAVERTFWEKATILHAEYHRPSEKALPGRLSRHYADIYQLIEKGVARNADTNLALLERVVQHKRLFFRSAWANYEAAKPGTLRIVPPPHRLAGLREDYRKMQEMFFSEPPSFATVLAKLGNWETDFNTRK
jgi:hypothetical protein